MLPSVGSHEPGGMVNNCMSFVLTVDPFQINLEQSSFEGTSVRQKDVHPSASALRVTSECAWLSKVGRGFQVGFCSLGK